MVCWRWANVLSGAGLICDLVRSSSLIDHTWIVDRATGSCNERQPGAEPRARGNQIANGGFKETTLHTRFSASGRFRRVSPVAARPGQCPLTLMSEVNGRGSNQLFLPTGG